MSVSYIQGVFMPVLVMFCNIVFIKDIKSGNEENYAQTK